uniref:Uncharacterized protein n=1 Tax=Populus trichocarpa TaxID=3694 RepID=A0A2K1X5B4_POPTR
MLFHFHSFIICWELASFSTVCSCFLLKLIVSMQNMVSSRPFIGITAKAPFRIWDKETMHQKYDLLLLYQCS